MAQVPAAFCRYQYTRRVLALKAIHMPMLDQMEKAVQVFGENPAAWGQVLRNLFVNDSEGFRTNSIRLLKSGVDGPGSKYLATLLFQHSTLVDQICDPEHFTREEALALARQVARVEPLLDTKLARLLPTAHGGGRQLPAATQDRVLEVLDAVSEGTRIVPMLAHLVQDTNARLRSKAALIIGRRLRNARWAEKHLQEMDPRVRANAIEALWGSDSAGVKDILWQATKDENNRVAGNAALGIYNLVDPAVVPLFLDMAKDKRSEFRATAVWLMGQTSDPRFLPAALRLVVDPDSEVRTNALKAIARIKQRVASCTEAGAIKVEWLRAEVQTDGTRRVNAIVLGQDGCLKGVSPLELAVWEDANLVTDYQLQEHRRPETLSVGFALCQQPDLSDEGLHAASESILKCLPQKKPGDFWGIARLGQLVADSIQFRWQGPTQAAGVESTTEVDPIRYSVHPEALKKAVQSLPVRVQASQILLEAVRLLLAGAVNTRGTRHIALLAGPDFEECRELDAVSKNCINAKATVHVVCLGVSSANGHPLDRLCSATGGFFMPAPREEDIFSAYERIFRGIEHRYEIQYRLAAQGPGELTAKLQIYSSLGAGAGQVALG